MALEKLKNEVLRKIGRNVMLFQQMERMLKCLLANGSYSGYASELKANQEQRAATIHKQTMGQVLGQYLENSFSGSEETKNEPEELKDGWCSFRFTIECGEEYYAERKNALASIVTERNDLIHHLDSKWDSNSYESGVAIEQYLDQQREKALPEFYFLQSQIQTLKNSQQIYRDFFVSDEFKKQLMLLLLRQSQLVTLLFEFAQQKARSDNWVVLNTAIQFISQNVPEELTDLYKKHGYKKLKEIILATEYFDISEELTNKGGIRVLYRIKPDLNLLANSPDGAKS